MILKIKTENKLKKIILFFLKLVITLIIYKVIKKKKYNEKFLISEKTF